MKKVHVVISGPSPDTVIVFEGLQDAQSYISNHNDYFEILEREIRPSSTIMADTSVNGWSVGDVLSVVERLGYAEISIGKAHKILQTFICKMDAAVGINWTTIETHVNRVADEEKWPRRTKQFKVCVASSNQNSFGLTGVVFVAVDGESYEVGMNQLNTERYPQGSIVTLRTVVGCNDWNWAAFGAEIPRELSLAPDTVIQELWGDARKSSDDATG